MSSDDRDAELQSLRRNIDSLKTQLGDINEKSSRTIRKLEDRLKDQEVFNTGLMRILEEKGISGVHTDDKVGGVDVDESDSCGMTNSFTQTNLAIDPETSVKLSFISAGISAYGSSIEYSMSHNKTIVTPLSSNNQSKQNHSSTRGSKDYTRYQSKEPVHPTSLSKEFVNQNLLHGESKSSNEQEELEKASPALEKPSGRPPPCPSSTTPSKQPPLKSILRTPTHERQSGPLSSFSPALSPIRSLKSAPEEDGSPGEEFFFNDSRIGAVDNKEITQDNGASISASLFMSPLRYDSSDADGSLQSMSLLNMTANTTLVSGHGGGPPSSQNLSSTKTTTRRRKSPRRRRTSSDQLSADSHHLFRGQNYESTTGTSGDDNVAAPSSDFRTPTKPFSGTPHSAHTTGYNKKRVNSMGLVRLQHFSESKRTSGFWKERLGKRDLTSILSSPLSQKLF